MRYHFIDAMRSVLMVLGVVLHAANVYTVAGQWEVHDSSTVSPKFDTLVELLGSFRMPAFFVIAGFFAQMMLERHGRKHFVTHRIRRLVVPFLASALAFNSAQLWLEFSWPQLTAHSIPFSSKLVEIFTSGRWLQHLWFLVTLLMFSVLALYSSRFMRSTPPPSEQKSSVPANLSGRLLPVFLLLGPLSEVMAHTVLHGSRVLMDGPFVLGLLDPIRLVTYVPFFLFGQWLFTNPDGMSDFCRPGLPTVVAVIAAFLLHRWLATAPEDRLHTVVSWGYLGISHWLGCHLCFSVFWRLVNGPSVFWRYCSDASYTVYLIHHLLVVIVAGCLVTVPWSASAKFLTVCCVVLVVAVLVHELFVRRIRLLSFLFNGK